jgi:ADP-ribose pyrophosphatase YjhB (NUDIX family)
MSARRGRFCPDCGAELPWSAEATPACPQCGSRQRPFPNVGVAVVLRDLEGRVLLGRRAVPFRRDLWCIPCGRLEFDEDVRAGAIRECREETGLEVDIDGVVAVHSNFHPPDELYATTRHVVGIWFGGHITGGELHCADGELTELAYFDPSAPPPLAFETDARVLAQLAAPSESPS